MNYEIEINSSLYEAVLKSALQAPGRTVIYFYGREFTYARLIELIDRAAGGLYDLGIRAGDVVTVCLPNSPAAAVALYALNKLGAIANLVHPFLPPLQLKEAAVRTCSKLIVAYDVYLAKHRLPADIPILQSKSAYYMNTLGKIVYKRINRGLDWSSLPAFEELFNGEPYGQTARFTDEMAAVYLPSGGTTGSPKIIMHNCRVFNELCACAPFFLADPIPSYQAMYSVLPIFHGFGLCMNLHMCMLMGVKNVMSMKFDARSMAKALRRHKVGIITGVPTMYNKLLKEPAFLKAKLPHLRECFVGGDAVDGGLVKRFDAQLKKAGSRGGMYIGYGLTETVTVCCVNTARFHRARSIGYPLPGAEFAIVKEGKRAACGEVGEICVKTSIIMLGYLDGGELPLKEFENTGWLFTGDYGYMDADGFLYFKQRIKNMIKVSGVPVYPSEIEEEVGKIAGVAYACAVGVADEIKGEVVRLYVQPAENTDIEELKGRIEEVCRHNLIAYAVPKQIIFKQLPVSAIGKIERKLLEEESRAQTG